MKAECRQFELQLGDFLEGSLPLSERSDAEEHMASCRECRNLYDIAVGDLNLLAGEAEQPLVGEILKKTSGPACDRALDEMCNLVDEAVTSIDARILSIHLQNCPSCGGIFRSLVEIRAILPQMARIWPGAGFTDDVLAATTRRSVQHEGRWTRARQWWTDLVHRPRLAWEVAYVATLILLVMMGNLPIMSMDAVKGKAHSAWNLAVFNAEHVSAAGLMAAEQTAERIGEHVAQHRAAAEGSLGKLWNQSNKIGSAALAVDTSLGDRCLSRARSILLNFAHILGLDRTFSKAMRYLEWVR